MATTIRAFGWTVCAVLLLVAGIASALPVPQPEKALPAPVLSAFRKAYPGASITAASSRSANAKTEYVVSSVDKGRTRNLVYAQDGTPLEVSEQTAENELPGPVRSAYKTHPRAIFVKAEKVTRGTIVQYVLELKGTRKTHMVVEPGGKVLVFDASK